MIIRKTLALMILLLLVSTLAQAQDMPCQSCSVVSDALTAYSKLHSEMTRAELEQHFRPDGGLSFPPVQVYVFKDCPMIKVEIRFEKLSDASDYDKAENKVRSFGRLYVDHPVMD